MLLFHDSIQYHMLCKSIKLSYKMDLMKFIQDTRFFDHMFFLDYELFCLSSPFSHSLNFAPVCSPKFLSWKKKWRAAARRLWTQRRSECHSRTYALYYIGYGEASSNSFIQHFTHIHAAEVCKFTFINQFPLRRSLCKWNFSAQNIASIIEHFPYDIFICCALSVLSFWFYLLSTSFIVLIFVAVVVFALIISAQG